MFSKCFFIPFVTIPYGSSYYRPNHTFNVPHSCTSTHKVFHFNFFSAFFCVILFSAIATPVSFHVFSFLSLLLYPAYFQCVLPDYVTLLHLHFHILAFVCVCVSFFFRFFGVYYYGNDYYNLYHTYQNPSVGKIYYYYYYY